MNRKPYTIEDVLFPVDLHPVYVDGGINSGQQGLFQNSNFRKVSGFSAVMAEDDARVFAVVAQNYGLVTNQEALNLGKACFTK